MRKLRTSGSVGGRAGNRSVYPTENRRCCPLRPKKRCSTQRRSAAVHLHHRHADDGAIDAVVFWLLPSTRTETMKAGSSEGDYVPEVWTTRRP